MMNTALIGIPADMASGEAPCHRVYDKYLTVITSLGALPVIIPAIGHKADITGLLHKLDGIFLPGSRSNVGPEHYGRVQEMAEPCNNHERDATSLPLIRNAVAKGTPVFGICRGLQELNVALGGTLYQQIDKMPNRGMHQFDEKTTKDIFAPSHEVTATPGSRLLAWVGQSRFMVNSMHNQAIDDLAPNLQIEALADDGTIEAVSVSDSAGFAYAVQWHPETGLGRDPVSTVLFAAFGEAVRSHARQGVFSHQ